MGQAKRKGTFEERQKRAIDEQRKLFPESIQCNKCGSALTEIAPLETKGIEGINLVGGAICSNCDSTTWLIDGTDEAMAKMHDQLNQMHDGDLMVGAAIKKTTE